MLTPYKIADYRKEYQPEWTCTMPDGRRGQADGRDAYLHPEVDNALYVVEVSGEALTATTLLQPDDLTEAMLPDAGYYYDAADLTEEAAPDTDTYQLEVPVRDRITFSTLIARMGWPALSLRKTIGKVAAL